MVFWWLLQKGGLITMKLYGVFIGINKYSDSRISNLSYAENDARSFYRLFKNTFSCDDVELHLLLNEQATKRKILSLLVEHVPKAVKSDDMVVIYYSGHGSPELDQSKSIIARYLICSDTYYDSLFTTGINIDNDINEISDRLNCNKVVFIFDTCFSGRAGGKTFEGAFLRDCRRGFRSCQKSFSDLTLGEGRVILSACKDDEVAYEDSLLMHGVFTYSILKVLTNRKFGEEIIGIGTFYDMVLKGVQQYGRHVQHPIMYGKLSNGGFPLLIESEDIPL